MSTRDPRAALRGAKRIVVKIGSSTLTREGVLKPRKFGELASQVALLMDEGREIVLVSSGAIAVGSRKLGWEGGSLTIPQMQAAAAVGQIGLLEHYQRRFAKSGRHVAQLLLTRTGLEDEERFLNASHTLHELLRLGAIPIVNENDTVATEEIRFGDNDNLSAIIANMVDADLLIILTDVDGLYAEAPVAGRPRPALIDRVEKITPEIRKAAQGAGSNFGRGGMITKLEAAATAARSATTMVLCNGKPKDILHRVLAGENVGTLFLPGARISARKHKLAFTNRTRGSLVLDDGASRALKKRRSLLPAGVVQVSGRFKMGDTVSCIDSQRREIARGLVAYTSEEADRIKGLATQDIERVLGYSNGNELIHRKDLVILDA